MYKHLLLLEESVMLLKNGVHVPVESALQDAFVVLESSLTITRPALCWAGKVLGSRGISAWFGGGVWSVEGANTCFSCCRHTGPSSA